VANVAVVLLAVFFLSTTTDPSFGVIASTYLLFALAMFHQTFAMTTLFTDPHLAGLIGAFLLQLPSLLYFLL